jgi:formate dehydrogenase iron-sulfur subunit
MTSSMAILTDTTLCIGCEKCVEACRQENHLPPDRPGRWKLRIDDLSSTRLTTIERREGDRFVRRQCRHCLEPACVSACIVGALQKTPEGPVVYDPNRCMGCRYCMVACPYGIVRYQWEEAIPYVRKCSMCHARLLQGRAPACVDACEQKATVFGTRESLLREAHRRIENAPDRYVGKVFGETEVGGTSVLYISDIPLDFLGNRPDLGDTPLPRLTWAALSKVPGMVIGVGGLMAGVFWITERRMRLAQESGEDSPGPRGSSHGDAGRPGRERPEAESSE